MRAARRMQESSRRLVLVGMRPLAMARLEQMGVASAIGQAHLYPTRPGWFEAMDEALRQSLAQLKEHHCEQCVLEAYLKTRA